MVSMSVDCILMEALENCLADTKCALVMLAMCDQASKSNLEWNSGNMCFNGTTKRWHFIHLETFTARSMLFEQAAHRASKRQLQDIKTMLQGHHRPAYTEWTSMLEVQMQHKHHSGIELPAVARAPGVDLTPIQARSFLSHTHNFAMRPCHTHTTLSHTTFTHVTTLSHTTLENHRSSTVSFVFPAFSVPLQPVFVIIGKS